MKQILLTLALIYLTACSNSSSSSSKDEPSQLEQLHGTTWENISNVIFFSDVPMYNYYVTERFQIINSYTFYQSFTAFKDTTSPPCSVTFAYIVNQSGYITQVDQTESPENCENKFDTSVNGKTTEMTLNVDTLPPYLHGDLASYDYDGTMLTTYVQYKGAGVFYTTRYSRIEE